MSSATIPAARLVEDLAAAGIRIWEENGKLLYRAPKGVMTAELSADLKSRKNEILALLRRDARIPAIPCQSDYELSHAQRRLWFLSQIEEGSAAYNVPLHQSIEGELDRAALESAFGRLVRRHESLRTTFEVVNGEPRQIVHADRAPELEFLDLTGKGRQSALRLAREESVKPFDLAKGPLLRLKLVRTGAAEHILLMTLHHLICDGVSVAVLANELNTLYRLYSRGESDSFDPLRIQYRDFAHWQNRELECANAATHRAYWQSKLTPPHPVLELPLDFIRPRQQSFEGREIAFELAPGRFAPLAQLARESGCSLFVVLQAMIKALLRRYTGQDEIVTGSPFAGQNHPDLEGQIGFYINMLPLRDQTPGGISFRDFVARVRQTVAEAYEHQTWPFDLIVNDAAIPRELARSPLFDVIVILQSQVDEGLALDGLRARSCFEHPGNSKFDLTFCFKEVAGRLILAIEYATALFGADRIERIGRHFEQLAASIAEDPSRTLDELRILPTDELEFALNANANVSQGQSAATFGEMFREQVEHTPDRVAILSEEGKTSLTYAELDRQSDSVAAWLRENGVGPDDLVAVLLPRTLDLPVALLGVLKAGAAYVPLDPALPPQRLQMILDDARPRLTIEAGTLARIAAAETFRLPPPFPENLAYVIYTSGSTGRPKGVGITHASLANFLASMRRAPGLAADDVLLAVTTMSFDIAVFELLLPLICGARIVLAGAESAVDGTALRGLIRAHGVTALQATPATWELLLASGWQGETPLRAFCGGEALRAHLAARLSGLASELWNLYGPTETTVWSAARRIEEANAASEDPAPVGGAVDATQLLVLNRQFSPQPIGVPGELFIGGDGLARGYRGNPRLTAEKFVPHPFSARPGSRIYATGDLVRLREDGQLSFLGRMDHQLKIRGFRIEPGDIEAALAQHPGIRECIVMARQDSTDEPILTAYFLARPGEQHHGPEELADFLRARVPGYMVPAAFVPVESWPLNPNGKIDRRALPPPDFQAAGPVARPTRPHDAREEILRGLFAEILHKPAVSSDDDFFALGGHSLLALRLANRINAVFEADLAIRTIFEARTASAIAIRIQQGNRRIPPLGRAERPPHLPLSWAQSRLWFLHRMGGQAAAYNITAALRLTGALDANAMEAALNDVVERHESLRTIVVESGQEPHGEPCQRILPPEAAHLELRREDIEAGELSERLRELAAEPIPIDAEIPFRAQLFRIAPDEHLLVLVLHHIAADGWSLGPLARDLGAAYSARAEGRAPRFAALPVQYADYTLWQRRYPGEGGLHAAQLDFWKTALAGMPDELRLPTDRLRPAQAGNVGGTVPLRVDAALHRRLSDLARREGATMFMVLQAGLAALLYRLGAGTDIPLGTPVAGRTDAALDDLVGLFVNTLVMRADLSGNPGFGQLIQRVRSFALGALSHQEMPFERLVAELQPARPGGRHPLFQVLIALQNLAAAELSLPNLSVRLEPVETTTAKFDISLNLDELSGLEGIIGSLEYSADLFDRGTAESIARRFVLLLEKASEDPVAPLSELAILLPGEREWLLEAGVGGSPPLPDVTIVNLLEAQAARTPGNAAVAFGEETVSYAELHRRANRLAHYLVVQGIGPETSCGICMERSAEALIAILAVLKAGGSYVPLDPEYPEARLALILETSRPPLVVCTVRTLPRLPADQRTLVLDLPEVRSILEGSPDRNPLDTDRRAPLYSTNVAYTIYTSGSTGLPKGIQVQHDAVVNLTASVLDLTKMGPESRMLQFASLNFDASVLEIFPAWAGGACVVVAGNEDRNPDRLSVLLRKQRVTHLFQTPAVLALLESGPGLGIECLMFGGEPCPEQVAARWSSACKSYSVYGPTETTVIVTASDILHGTESPIGRPLFNTRLYVLNPSLQPTPPGVEGELYVGGDGLARGYAEAPAFTAERFIPDPFAPLPGERMYRTGDAVRYLPDGQLEFLRRLDDQVKIRGNRIETHDIELVLETHPAVRQAAVMVITGQDGNPALGGFVGRRANVSLSSREIRGFARERMPEYMVPSGFVVLDELPLTPTGKVDRRALAAIEIEYAGREAVAPRDEVERVLAGMFCEVLRLESVGAEDEFFELGGHSLLATQVASRIRKVFGVELPLARFFEGSTVANLARHLQKSESSPGRTIKIARAYERLKSLSPEEKARMLEAKRAAVTAD